MTIPHAIFGGLALIALSIYFTVGSLPVHAFIDSPQKVVICNTMGNTCADVSGIRNNGSLNVRPNS